MYRSEKINNVILTDHSTNKKVILPGWAVLDMYDYTVIQVNGENKYEILKEYYEIS